MLRLISFVEIERKNQQLNELQALNESVYAKLKSSMQELKVAREAATHVESLEKVHWTSNAFGCSSFRA